jgi:NAD(P)-dependent dehydrogenase (short-subunit alcohol dehydrogenase family)
MDLKLRGKVAVLTGASVGIGLAVAEGFAAEGVNLVLAARQRERLEQVAAEIASRYGVRVVPVGCDVSASEGVDALVDAAHQQFGGADILFNNAGTGSNETIMEAPDDKWQAYWDLHVMAAVRLARGLVPSMKRRGGGAILHNASICAVQPLGYEPIYNVTKAALMMFSKNLAHEVVKDNIRVNTINPGLVLTPDWVKTAKELTQNCKRWRTSSRRSAALRRPRSWRISSYFSARSVRATALGRPISSMGGCCGLFERVDMSPRGLAQANAC